MYRGHDAETFVQAVEGKLSVEQRDAWRKAHLCDDYHPAGEDDQDLSNMFFRELELLKPDDAHTLLTADLFNADGEE